MNALAEFLTIFADPYGRQIAASVLVMLELTLATFVFGFAWGAILALLRASPLRPLRMAIALYVEYHRNVPLVIQMFIWYFGVPQLLPKALQAWVNRQPMEFFFATVALVCAFGAYVAEDIRSGIRSLDGRQEEAARALGFSYLSAMFWIVLPQALRISAPSLINQALLFFKSTSLAMTIGVAELTYRTKTIQDETYRTYAIFSVATVIYLLISFLLMAMSARLQRREGQPT